MNAEQFLNESLGGNMNISTLKPLAWHKIMEAYAQHKIKESVKTRNLIHSKACGVEAGLTSALFKVARLKSHPKWLVKLLRETLDKAEDVRQEIAKHRDEVKE